VLLIEHWETEPSEASTAQRSSLTGNGYRAIKPTMSAGAAITLTEGLEFSTYHLNSYRLKSFPILELLQD
jgi:hypothetical protein